MDIKKCNIREKRKIVMQNNATPAPTQATSSLGSIALLRLLIARHPYASALFFLVYWLALLLALGRVLSPIYLATHLPFLLYETMAEVLLALIVILPITLLKWWPEIGFTRGINGRGILICLFPIILIAGPSILGLPLIVGQASGLILATAITLSLLVGFAEEGMFRGVLLRSLLPKGIGPAVLISALCFACVHLTNLLSGASWGYVLGQLVLAFGTGVLFATLRLRTGSIWPCILLHAARDVVGLIYFGINPAIVQATPSNTANIVNIVFCFVYLLISFILLRPSQVRKLKLIYGLVTQPVTTFPGYPPAGSPPQPSSGYTPYQQGHPSYPPASYPPQPYPGYGNQPPVTPVDNPPQPYPGEVAYHEYTSPAAYGEAPAHGTGSEKEQ
jgi:membrane protease YdiL (CAAX protease family)